MCYSQFLDCIKSNQPLQKNMAIIILWKVRMNYNNNNEQNAWEMSVYIPLISTELKPHVVRIDKVQKFLPQWKCYFIILLVVGLWLFGSLLILELSLWALFWTWLIFLYIFVMPVCIIVLRLFSFYFFCVILFLSCFFYYLLSFRFIIVCWILLSDLFIFSLCKDYFIRL